MRIDLIWAGVDATLGTADDVGYTTTTDATGTWLVTDLPAGLFEVAVDAPARRHHPGPVGRTRRYFGNADDRTYSGASLVMQLTVIGMILASLGLGFVAISRRREGLLARLRSSRPA